MGDQGMRELAVILIAIHAIADFFLQTDELARRKRKLRYLLLHTLIHAALTYLILQAWACWQAPLFVFVFHLLIDCIKQRSQGDTAGAFVADQAVHTLSLITLAWLLVRFSWEPAFSGVGYKQIVVFAGFAATVRGSGLLITKYTKRIVKENSLKFEGLLNGGKVIGQLERSLIFLFIFIGQPAGIGFLVAAKSILRLEEAKKQKLAEYVLIGTLLSFSLAVALASATKWAADL